MATIIAFIVVFFVLVLVHEFGHFIFAKRSGILVREFSIGMGPKLIATRRNHTTYTLRLLPLGGYVRMAGWQDEDDEIKPGTQLAIELNSAGVVTRINTSDKTTLQGGIPVQVGKVDLTHDLVIEGYANGNEDELQRWAVDHDATIIEPDGTEVIIAPEDVQFQNASIWKRLLVNFAGPMNNFILAILVFIGVGAVAGVQQLDTNQIGQIVQASPAAKAGLPANATIISVNGKQVASFTAIANQVGKTAKGDAVRLRYRAPGSQAVKSLAIQPKSGTIGIYPSITHNFGTAVGYGFSETWSIATRIFHVLGQMVTGHFSLNKLAGPVGIYTMTSQAASGGVMSLVVFAAYLSVNLGVMNLIPIPVLDGGKILLNLIELIRRKPLSQEKEGLVTLIGAGAMVLLMIAVTINDIMRQF